MVSSTAVGWPRQAWLSLSDGRRQSTAHRQTDAERIGVHAKYSVEVCCCPTAPHGVQFGSGIFRVTQLLWAAVDSVSTDRRRADRRVREVHRRGVLWAAVDSVPTDGWGRSNAQQRGSRQRSGWQLSGWQISSWQLSGRRLSCWQVSCWQIRDVSSEMAAQLLAAQQTAAQQTAAQRQADQQTAAQRQAAQRQADQQMAAQRGRLPRRQRRQWWR